MDHLFLVGEVFAGLTAVLSKVGLKNVSGDAGLVIAQSFGFILVWLNALAFKHVTDFPDLQMKDVIFLLLSGITTTLSWIFYHRTTLLYHFGY